MSRGQLGAVAWRRRSLLHAVIQSPHGCLDWGQGRPFSTPTDTTLQHRFTLSSAPCGGGPCSASYAGKKFVKPPHCSQVRVLLALSWPAPVPVQINNSPMTRGSLTPGKTVQAFVEQSVLEPGIWQMMQNCIASNCLIMYLCTFSHKLALLTMCTILTFQWTSTRSVNLSEHAAQGL